MEKMLGWSECRRCNKPLPYVENSQYKFIKIILCRECMFDYVELELMQGETVEDDIAH